ncbi:MAG: DUF362 domain-containing protein [Chloroflexi bacterium]|nr:MAG: DUF362 domain-containing protein [Chloroflexota bacterium]
MMAHSSTQHPPRVRGVACDYRSSDEEVYQALKRATDPLDAAWEKLGKARRIGVKFNQDWNRTRVVTHAGHRQQLVSDPVARATLRLLRERTTAEVFAVDVGVIPPPPGETREEGATPLLPIYREFGVQNVDGHFDAVKWVSVPGGGQMFEQYPIPQSTAEADAMVSVQKLKNHAFMGVTLCLKNLFGLMPLAPAGRPRHYYHHLVRMPYMLADIGRIFNPALNIIDGLVCQAGEEWGKGEHPRICNTLIAGDQVIATDAFATTLMGHDPQSDWLTEPFHRDRNALLIAAQSGFGTVDLNQIDYQSEVTGPVGQFFSKQVDPREMVVSWRRTTAEQGLYYLDHKKEIVDKYAGKYILLQMGEVRWADESGSLGVSRRDLAGAHPEQAMWFKFIDPDESEGEHFEVYEQTMRELANLGLLEDSQAV